MAMGNADGINGVTIGEDGAIYYSNQKSFQIFFSKSDSGMPRA